MKSALLSPGAGGPLPVHRPPTTDLRLPASRLSPSTPRARQAHAFSLVELLAVVGIIALISVAAVPVMRGLGGSQSSRATAQILVSALEQARTAAILSRTNVYLITLNSNNASYPRQYGIVRPSVDQDGDGRDDYQTNAAASSWIVLSKWEKLPGDLVFSTNRLDQLPTVEPQGLVTPPRTSVRPRGIGFLPSGGLENEAATLGLFFASSNRISNNVASLADRIELSFYSGRVRYAGLTNGVDPF